MEKSKSILLSVKEVLESKVAKLFMFILLCLSSLLYVSGEFGAFGITNNCTTTLVYIVMFIFSASYFLYSLLAYVFGKISNSFKNINSKYYLTHYITVDESRVLYEYFYDKSGNIFKRSGYTGESGAQEISMVEHKIIYLSGTNGFGSATFNLHDNIVKYLNKCIKKGKIIFINIIDTEHYAPYKRVLPYTFIIKGCKYNNQPDITSYNEKDFVVIKTGDNKP